MFGKISISKAAPKTFYKLIFLNEKGKYIFWLHIVAQSTIFSLHKLKKFVSQLSPIWETISVTSNMRNSFSYLQYEKQQLLFSTFYGISFLFCLRWLWSLNWIQLRNLKKRKGFWQKFIDYSELRATKLSLVLRWVYFN